jgi:hypothetical protein
MALFTAPGIDIGSALRNPGAESLLGDSRAAGAHADGAFLNRSSANIFTWGDTLAGRRMTMAKNAGVSGWRSDQMLANVDAVIASGAGTNNTHVGVNDVAQAATGFVSTLGPMAGQTITLANVGQHVAQNVQFAHSRIMGAGFRNHIVCLEPGAINMNAQQVTCIHEINQRHREWSEAAPGVTLADLPSVLWDRIASGSLIAFKAGYRRANVGQDGVVDSDPTHLSSAGGYAVGAGVLAPIYQAIAPANPRGLISINEVNSGTSNINQMANPFFVSGSGGTPGTGVSGTIAASFGVSRSSLGTGPGTHTAVCSVNTLADGTKEQVIACTFSGAGDAFQLTQDWVLASWNFGDPIYAGCEVSIDDCTGLAGATMYLQAAGNSGGTSSTTMDLLPLSSTPKLFNQFTTGALTIPLLTERMVIPTWTTKSWVTERVIFFGAAATTVTVRVRKMMGKRRFT